MYAELREVWKELTGPGAMFEVVTQEIHGRPLRTYANAPATLRDFWLGLSDEAREENR